MGPVRAAGACFFSREAVQRAGPLDESLHSSFDVDFFVRVRRQGPFIAVDEVWAEETIHPDAKTSAQPGRSLAELHVVQMRHGFEAIAVAQMTAELEELCGPAPHRRFSSGRSCGHAAGKASVRAAAMAT